MSNYQNPPKDLFECNPSGVIPNPNRNEYAFLDNVVWTLKFNHLALLAIGILFLLTMSFILGFNSGKSLSAGEKTVIIEENAAKPLPKQNAQIEVAKESSFVEVLGNSKIDKFTTDEVKEVLASIEEAKVEAKKADPNSYTIQWVTYKTMSAAEKLISQLKSKGLTGYAIQSGNYVFVCVNTFENKGIARTELSALKKSGVAPPDAYIRKMPALAA